MDHNKLSTRQIILDIGSMQSQAKILYSKGHKYSRLLEVLIEISFYYDEDIPVPTLKDLSALTGIKYQKLRKQISEIYNELIFSYQEDKPLKFSFKKITYCFSARGIRKDQYAYFESDSLPIIPSLGDAVNMPFFRAFVGTASFYVDKVYHSFTDERQEVHISLVAGSFNPYWYFRKHEAVEKGEVGIHDFYDLEEWQLKRKLGLDK